MDKLSFFSHINSLRQLTLPIGFCLAGFINQAQAFNATIALNTNPGAAVNRLLLGNNTQWVGNGDSLVNNDGTPNAQAVNLVQPVGASMLRYPGGVLADSFHWQDSIGNMANRGADADLNGNLSSVVFGFNEFLSLAKTLNATPLVTVNIPSGTPAEAAGWVSYAKQQAVNGSPPVQYWELGNEPYLNQAARPDLWMSPGTFVSSVNNFVPAMRAADPTIKIGVPLRTDRSNGVWVTAYPGFNKTVLAGLTVPIDYVALHYYFPFANNGLYTDNDLYWAGMAAADTMAQDIAATTALVKSTLKTNVPIAVTEYNSMFTLGKGNTDAYISSLQGALLAADMLRVFTQNPNVLFANFWSALGNWYFGMIDQNLTPRVANYYVMQLYSKLLNGNYLAANVSSPTFTTNSVGLIPASTLPLLTSVAALDGNGVIRMLVINKSISDIANLEVDLSGSHLPVSATPNVAVSLLTGDSPLGGTPGLNQPYMQYSNQALSGNTFTFAIPPHSAVLFEIN